MKNQLIKRELPSIPSREEIIDILQREEYGYLPRVDFSVSYSEPELVYGLFDKGNVEHTFITLTVNANERSHSFRVDRLLHKDGKKRPTVILNNFHPIYASRYFAIEEISEMDIDVISVVYTDACSDDGDFENGLAPLLLPNGQDTDTTCGKIGIWAWTNMRLVDYALTLPTTDESNIGVMGHSRLGKTALFTGMLDERIKFVFSNAAGCAGDAIARGNSGFDRGEDKFATGELISDITERFPYWFCKNYFKYAKTDIPDGFDQHFLLASIAPRYLLVGSCSLDMWADPVSQQLCVLSASEAWEKKGLEGVIGCDTPVTPGTAWLDGHLGFFMIDAHHYLSRHSWRRFYEFIMKHK